MNNKSLHFLKVCVFGEEVFRFINICVKNGIHFFDVRYAGDSEDDKDKRLEFFITVKDYFKIRRPVRLSKVRLIIIKKYGPGFMINKYRKHLSFVIGICMAIVIIKITSLYLWNIRIDGNYINSYNQVVKVLEENDITTATKISSINCEKLEELLKDSLSEIAWINVRIQGTSLVIDVKENLPKDDIFEKKEDDTSLIAGNSGTVSSIVTRRGTPVVKVGDYVQEGDILVKGIVDLTDDNGEVSESRHISADADVYISTTIAYEDLVDLRENVCEYDGECVRKFFVGINNKCIRAGFRLKKDNDYTKVVEISNVKFGSNIFTPIIFGVERYYSYETVEINISAEEAEAILKKRLKNYIDKLDENGVQISDYRVNINSSMSTISLQAEIYANILQTTVKKLEFQGDQDNNG